jgi:Ca2+-binding RTX toxin-like protein
MVTQFTENSDTYTVTGTDTYALEFLGGDDRLTIDGGTYTTAWMGDGNDLAFLRSGAGTVYGESGSDRFDLYGDGFQAIGGGDNDIFYLRGGSDVRVTGDDGDDKFTILATTLGLRAYGGDGNDLFLGRNKVIEGTIHGDAGNDRFYEIGSLSGNIVVIYGGTGNDLYRASAAGPATFVELVGEGIDSVQVARGADYTLPDNIENISVQGFHGSDLSSAVLEGNALDNVIIGHNNDEELCGMAGNDRVFGKGGNDFLCGDDGNDYLDGGTGNDEIEGGAGNDVINGRAGDDLMTGGSGDDTYYVDSLGDVIVEDVGGGTDTARVSSTASGYTLADNVENGIVNGSGGTTIHGNDLDNHLSGNSGDDILYGHGGNDELRGGGGDDQLYGGEGDDYLSGGTGADYMEGAAGDDTYVVDNPGDVVNEGLLGGIDTVISAGVDVILGANVENGEITGNVGATLTGNALDNVLSGSAGADVLIGGLGADTLTGGLGADVFLYTDGAESSILSADTLVDFDAATDTIDLSGIDANGLLSGDQAFTLVDTLTLGLLGQVVLVDLGNTVQLIADSNGDLLPDLIINLNVDSTVGLNIVL